MSVAGYIDTPLDQFGGLVTDMPASDLPLGVSPDCQDVAFLPGAVRTRPGLQNIFTPIADAGPVNPTVNYLKTYITPAGQEIMLALDAAGFLWAELTSGALTQIAQGITPNAVAKSTSLCGRKGLAMRGAKFGMDIARQYDATNFDRV